MEIMEYPDFEMLCIDLANALAGELTAALQHSDRIAFGVPGGTTPGPVFDDLCAADLDWSRVDVMLTDERWVPESDPRSNTRLVRERLLVNRAADARLVPLYAAAHAPQEVLAELESMIAPVLPLSVLLMGMGADMHVASLFPGAEGLSAALEPQAPILLPMTQPGTGEARVSLSARVLDGALSKHLVIAGPQKRAALERALTLPPEEAPVRTILQGTVVHWAEN